MSWVGTRAEQQCAGVKPGDAPAIAKLKVDLFYQRLRGARSGIGTSGGGGMATLFLFAVVASLCLDFQTVLYGVGGILALVVVFKVIVGLLGVVIDLAALVPWRIVLHGACYIGLALLIGGLLYSAYE